MGCKVGEIKSFPGGEKRAYATHDGKKLSASAFRIAMKFL